MEDNDLRASGNIEDRRGMGGATKGGLGLGAILVLLLISWLTGINPATLIGGAEMVTGGGGGQVSSAPGRQGAPTDPVGNSVGETEDVWSQVLPQQTGRQYEKPVLVLFSGVTQSAVAWRNPTNRRRTRCPSRRS